MPRPCLEVADIVRGHGDDYRARYSPSNEQLRVMRAIEACRTASLGGHIGRCCQCGHQIISYNSCRNRHCPKCQRLAKAAWIQARQSELLPVPYFHIVFTIPDAIAPLALQNKRVVYNILFQAASRTLLSIAADARHLGARIGVIAILHSWGQNLMHHPHLHCLVPGGGLSTDESLWIGCQRNFFLPVRVLSRLFRRLFLETLQKAFDSYQLEFHGRLEDLCDAESFQRLVQHCRNSEWVVYAKPPFGGPRRVLDYLGRYTHRIAISNDRLQGLDQGQVTFRWRNYTRARRQQTMTLRAHEFIRRFLLHVLPEGFVRIRYYGFLANRHRVRKLRQCRSLLGISETGQSPPLQRPGWQVLLQSLTGIDPTLCPICKQGRIVTIGTIEPVHRIRAPPLSKPCPESDPFSFSCP